MPLYWSLELMNAERPDEAINEAPEAEIEQVSELVRSEMEGALKLRVPLVADVGVGENWLEAH